MCLTFAMCFTCAVCLTCGHVFDLWGSVLHVGMCLTFPTCMFECGHVGHVGMLDMWACTWHVRIFFVCMYFAC